MLTFHTQPPLKYELPNAQKVRQWIENAIKQENADLEIDDISIIFCTDDYLYQMNVQFLQHDTLTDVITFDYSTEHLIAGDIFISLERVRENALLFQVAETEELHRVIIHGILHLLRYTDKTSDTQQLMRKKEDFYLKQFR